MDGMLAISGVSVLTGRGVVDRLVDAWFNEAQVVVNDSSNNIVSANFIGQVDERESNKPANFVKSDTPETPVLLALV